MIGVKSIVGTPIATRVHAQGEGVEEINAGHLRAFVERIERLHEERKALAEDISEIYAELKGAGFDPKVVREVIKYRAKDPDKRSEEETLLELYLSALRQA